MSNEQDKGAFADITDEEKRILDDALSIMSYDEGFTCAGLRDDVRKEQIKAWLCDQCDNHPDRFRVVLARYIRDEFLSEDRLKDRYGLEDVSLFFRWLDSEMDFPVFV